MTHTSDLHMRLLAFSQVRAQKKSLEEALEKALLRHTVLLEEVVELVRKAGGIEQFDRVIETNGNGTFDADTRKLIIEAYQRSLKNS